MGKFIGGDEVLADEVAERDALLGPEPPAFRVWTAKFLECCPERCPGGVYTSPLIFRISCKPLISIVGAHGLEPWTR